MSWTRCVPLPVDGTAGAAAAAAAATALFAHLFPVFFIFLLPSSSSSSAHHRPNTTPQAPGEGGQRRKREREREREKEENRNQEEMMMEPGRMKEKGDARRRRGGGRRRLRAVFFVSTPINQRQDTETEKRRNGAMEAAISNDLTRIRSVLKNGLNSNQLICVWRVTSSSHPPTSNQTIPGGGGRGLRRLICIAAKILRRWPILFSPASSCLFIGFISITTR